MHKIIIYSAVVLDYDMVFKPNFSTKSIECILFSDSPASIRGWKTLPIDRSVAKSSSLINRWYKIFPHKVFPDADISIYIDGNIRILSDLDILIDEFINSNAALGVFSHMERTTIFEEAEACRALGKFDENDKKAINNQLKVYTKFGFPKTQLLTDNGIIFRRHGHPKLAEAMELWWTHLNQFTKRDQISLPFVVWKYDLPVKVWNWSFRAGGNAYFLPYKHLKRKTAIRALAVILSAKRDSNVLAQFAHRNVSRLLRLLG